MVNHHHDKGKSKQNSLDVLITTRKNIFYGANAIMQQKEIRTQNFQDLLKPPYDFNWGSNT